jgi:HAD superfamily hydrolase (TIGR01484 family)
MRPISEIDRRPAVLLFDVDDTVTAEGRVQACALDALERARGAGLRTAAVTGRPLGWAEVIAWTWPVDLAIGENGAGWMWREGRALEARYFDDAATRASQRARLDEVVARVAREMPSVPLAGDSALRRCDVAWDVGETRRASAEELSRLAALVEGAGLRTTTSSVHLHAVPGAWDKASGAVRALRDHFGMDAATAASSCAFVGDSGNDAAAFAFFAVGVGVANVREHLDRLPVPPRFVTERPRGLGFAELVDLLLSRQRSTGGGT